MTLFTPQLKHHILTQYQSHNRNNSFVALAQLYNIPSGESTIRKWYRRWNGSAASLERRKGSGRPRLLNRAQVNSLIRVPIRNKNRAHTAIHYTQLLPTIREKTGTQLSLRSVQRYGQRDVHGKGKHTKKTTSKECKSTYTTNFHMHCMLHECILIQFVCVIFSCHVVLSSHCDAIACVRRKIQRIPKDHVLFLDETAVRLSEAPTTTIVLPDEQPFVLVEDDSSYAKRFDMIACVNIEKTFAPCIYTPNERSSAGVRGINTEMLVDYILNTLGQETAALDIPPLTMVVDKSRIHNIEAMMDAFRERGGHVMNIILMPTKAAKRMSPLDNALFHDWKEAVRKHGPLTLTNMEQAMADEWNNITTKQIYAHYKHCGLTRRQDVYADCPLPRQHKHNN